MSVPCVQNGAVPMCSVPYSKSKSGSFLVGVWYVLRQLVLVCSSALRKQPDLVMGWVRRNPIICECVLSCCTVLLTYFTADHIPRCYFVLGFQPM